MPKIEVYAETLYKYMNKKMSNDELEEILPVAKAELDDVLEDEGTLKIELNDTNRPDLWSTTGLGRQFRIYREGNIPKYDFFSNKDETKNSEGREIIVDKNLKNIRPYIAAFAIKGNAIDDAILKDIIQTQEKLCWNFGRKRKSIAMGVYRSDLISFPINYTAADPVKTKFQPLQMDKELNLNEIIKEHPKGQEFGHIVKDFDKYPFITDSNGDVLSFPPIINSDKIGAVEVGDDKLFIELTGTDLDSLLLAASIVACDFSDQGYEILPVKTIYSEQTPYGKEITCPYYFQKNISVDIDSANKLLGTEMDVNEAKAAIEKMGCPISINGDILTLTVPEYRNDFLHPVDIIEDIMMGKGLAFFEPEMPSDYTAGKLTDEQVFGRKVRDIMVGLGFQEMMYNYLGSKKDYIEKMNIDGKELVQISNPMTENYEYVRNSIMPALMNSESISANAVYPHNIFETGKVAFLDDKENTGTKTINSLGFLSADKDAGFNLVNSQVSAVFYYLNKEYELKESSDTRFIQGRCADIYSKNKKVGVFGEVNPVVLEHWGIQVPATSCEIDLDLLLK